MNNSITLAADIDFMRSQVKNFKILNRRDLKRALILRYGSLSNAAIEMGVDYQALSDAINGRRYAITVVAALQREFGLSDKQVLEFWPLLKTWPKNIY
jgi:large exoprotein involved in heme utilization and adhesion